MHKKGSIAFHTLAAPSSPGPTLDYELQALRRALHAKLPVGRHRRDPRADRRQ